MKGKPSKKTEQEYFTPKKYPQIYVYSVPNQTGLKVGYTERENVEERISEGLVKTPNPQYSIEYKTEAITLQGDFFKDYLVHEKLKNRGIKKITGEWFNCSLDEVISVITEIKTGKKQEAQRNNIFKMRPEQNDAVQTTKKYFEKYSRIGNKKTPHFLWNAKMRFGKTFTSYQLAKSMGWKKILILTYKPATEKQWREDLETHIDFEGWQFLSNKSGLDFDRNKPIVWFASYQDVLGRDKGQTVKDKHKAMRGMKWDCLIVDEYHFGAWKDTAKELAKEDGGYENPLDKEDEERLEEIMPLKVNHYLYLSGTPFRAMANGEFSEDQIYNWTYADEQRTKENWNNKKGENPYEELPKIIMMTYRMPEKLREVAMQGEFNEFDLNTFFKAKKENGLYLFEKEDKVKQWLDLLRGVNLQENVLDGMNSSKPPILFEDARLKDYLNHTFWFLPSVASCKAMERLLKRDQFYNQYNVICAAGTDAGIGQEAIAPVEDAIGNPFNTKTITLSCGKLTTGVTIKPWTGVLFLRNTESPETYFQTAFRAQNPWVLKNFDKTDKTKKEIIKPICYIFDFAPNRALKLISDYIVGLDNSQQRPETKVGEFLKFLPVLCYDGSHMYPMNAIELLDTATFGATTTMLARRWQSRRLVDVTNVVLEKLMNDKNLCSVLEKFESFRNLSKDIKKIITSEKSINKTKRENKPLTEKQKKEEKENKGFKEKLKENLLKFLARIPAFMYLTDHREESLVDVIRNLESTLFTKVTGLKIKDFDRLREIGVFNELQLNGAVWQFRMLEDSSLIYAGGRDLKGNEIIGGFDSKLSREEIKEIIEKI